MSRLMGHLGRMRPQSPPFSNFSLALSLAHSQPWPWRIDYDSSITTSPPGLSYLCLVSLNSFPLSQMSTFYSISFTWAIGIMSPRIRASLLSPLKSVFQSAARTCRWPTNGILSHFGGVVTPHPGPQGPAWADPSSASPARRARLLFPVLQHLTLVPTWTLLL